MAQDDAPAASPRRPTPPWIFLLAMIPVGTTQGHSLVALPYLLKTQFHLPVAQIAALTSWVFVPHGFKFVWAPILDTLMKRKHWHLATALLATIGTMVAFLIPPGSHFYLLTAVLVLVNIASATSSSALGSLCATTVRPELKGVASGYFSTGSLASNGLMGGLMILLAEPPAFMSRLVPPLSMPAIGVISCSVMLATTLVALAIDEPDPVRRPLWALLSAIGRDTWGTVRSRAGWTGLLICLSPVGSAAASNVFGALAQDFHASAGHVFLATGLPAGLANAAGALGGGWLADRMNRRVAYVIGGGATAVCAVALALSPMRWEHYVFWTLAYAVASGLAYAAFYAFVFEMIGPTAGASTKYGLFIGVANLATAYVTYLDGLVYAHGARLLLPSGSIGLLYSDAALNLLGIALLGVMLLYLRRRPLVTGAHRTA